MSPIGWLHAANGLQRLFWNLEVLSAGEKREGQQWSSASLGAAALAYRCGFLTEIEISMADQRDGLESDKKGG